MPLALHQSSIQTILQLMLTFFPLLWHPRAHYTETVLLAKHHAIPVVTKWFSTPFSRKRRTSLSIRFCFVISLSDGRIFDSLRGYKETNEKPTKEVIFVLWRKPSWILIFCFPLKKIRNWKNYQGRSQSVAWIRQFLIITKFLLNSNYCWKLWVLKTNNEEILLISILQVQISFSCYNVFRYSPKIKNCNSW